MRELFLKTVPAIFSCVFLGDKQNNEYRILQNSIQQINQIIIFCIMNQEQLNIQQTFMLIKPDGVQRKFIGKIITKIEQTGLKLIKIKIMKAEAKIIKQHYQKHLHQSYFQSLCQYMTSSPIVAIACQGPNAISTVRRLLTSINQETLSGTIRGDYSIQAKHFSLQQGRKKCVKNICHASQSKEEAMNQLQIWFQISQNFKEKIQQQGKIEQLK